MGSILRLLLKIVLLVVLIGSLYAGGYHLIIYMGLGHDGMLLYASMAVAVLLGSWIVARLDMDRPLFS